MGTKKFILVGYFGGPNFGDEMVALTAAEILSHQRNKVVVAVANPEFSAESELGSYSLIKGGYPGHLKILDILRILEEVNDADAILYPGGGILQDVHGANLIEHCMFYALLACLFNKPYYLAGVGVGPIRSANSKKMAIFLLSNSSFAYVRDKASYRLTAELLSEMPRHIRLATDSVFAAKGKLSDQKTNEIILAFRAWRGVDTAWISAIAQKLLAEGLKPCLFVCEPNDINLYLKVSDSIKPSIKIYGWSNPNEAVQVIASSAGVISMRLHPLIVALKHGVPVVAVSYDEKIPGLMEKFEMKNNVFPIGTDPGTLVHALKGSKPLEREALERDTQLAREMFSGLNNSVKKSYPFLIKIKAALMIVSLSFNKLFAIINYKLRRL